MTIPSITPYAGDLPQRSDPSTFPARADAYVTWQEGTLAPELNLTVTAMNQAVSDVNDDVAASAASASAASDSEIAAAASAASAIAAPGTQATSTTSLTVGTGSKSLTIQTGKAYSVGQAVVIADTALPSTNWMFGQVTSHDSGTGALVVNVAQTLGSGTIAAWTVSITASPAASGAAIVRRAVTGTDTAILSDLCKLIDVTSGTFSLSFTAAATLGSGWYCYIKNSGTGAVTLDPNSSETIDGATTLSLYSGECRIVQCDGSALRTTRISGSSGGFTLAPLAGGTLTDRNTIYSFGAAVAYTLPDLTNASNFGVAMLANSPAAPTTLTTSDGWVIAPNMVANTLKVYQPILTYNAHGWWGNVSMTPPIVATVSTTSGPTLLGTVALSSTCHVIMYTRGGSTYVVALNPTTNTFGSAQTLGAVTGNAKWSAIYADSATTFVAFVASGTSSFACAGSVSSVTITLGTATAAFGNYTGFSDTPLQLAAGSYFVSTCRTVAQDLYALTVSGTTITVGTAVASGCGASSYGVMCEKVTSTTVLITYPSATSGSGQMRAHVATISGSTISSVGTGVNSTGATNWGQEDGPCLTACRAFAAAGPYIIGMWNTDSASINFRGLTVSGTTPTWGASVNMSDPSNLILHGWFARDTFVARPLSGLSSKFLIYSATQALMPVAAANTMLAWSISGATLTAGSDTGSYSNVKYTTDLAGTTFYSVDSAAFRKITVSGTTITTVETQSVSPTVIGSTTSNDKSFYYGSTWYAWTGFPTFLCAITATKWLAAGATSFDVYEVSI